jgi:hypothetical protein
LCAASVRMHPDSVLTLWPVATISITVLAAIRNGFG